MKVKVCSFLSNRHAKSSVSNLDVEFFPVLFYSFPVRSSETRRHGSIDHFVANFGLQIACFYDKRDTPTTGHCCAGAGRIALKLMYHSRENIIMFIKGVFYVFFCRNVKGKSEVVSENKSCSEKSIIEKRF
ncbi:hypothetical protein CDAR_595671 [Caerostris darwini]|uniref:Uncharacterized protein n=1 Tax=Caerostris darwini TaxID=1538125 RepID=A0AAV4Q577_9ARAC|nr:hypothetical protein CDAR_595671 [Caerostris darwini]